MKVARLLSIVIMLLNKKRITAKDLADYFEVSIRTIQRDIESINMAGIPIISYKGQFGGYEILDNYKIDKNFLSDSEHSLLLTSLKGINKAYEDKCLRSIIEKLTSIKSQNSSNGENRIIMDFSPWGFSKSLKDKVDTIKKAVDIKRVISFNYIDLNGNSTKRLVEPALLALKINSWYLYGYCRLRQDFRLFKITRLRELIITNEPFDTRENDFDFNFIFPSENTVKLKLKFTPKALNRLDDYFEFENLDFNKDGYIYAYINYPEDEWVYSMILSFGNNVEVIEPHHIREIIKYKAKNILEKYE
ncbi:MAG: YafY family transcriptional regulator [Maledivibacter sp.]|jgi:predicted DNA-binding transcriptional regulator YafY|nr:YafY family transcriptional regulator [Maledivibacter sp.]